jgi:hypothetical protein
MFSADFAQETLCEDDWKLGPFPLCCVLLRKLHLLQRNLSQNRLCVPKT